MCRRVAQGIPHKSITFVSLSHLYVPLPASDGLRKLFFILYLYGESAGARTQDQRLKRAMLYQLSYALEPHYKVSTVGGSFPGRNAF